MSARDRSSVAAVPAVGSAIPMLTDGRSSWPCTVMGSDSACWSRVATSAASSRSVIRCREHHELVAAESREQVPLTDRTAEARREGHEQGIAGRVAERVVHELEPVDVELEHREPRRRIAPDELVEGVEQDPPVGEAGEAVVRRLVHQRLAGAPPLRGVTAHEHHVGHVAVGPELRRCPGLEPAIAGGERHLVLVGARLAALEHHPDLAHPQLLELAREPELVDTTADDVLGRDVAGVAQHRLVQVHVAQLSVDADDRVGRVVDERAQLLLTVAELGFACSRLGDVLDRAAVAEERAVGIVHRLATRHDRQERAVLADDARLEVERLPTRDRRVPIEHDGGEVVRVHETVEVGHPHPVVAVVEGEHPVELGRPFDALALDVPLPARDLGDALDGGERLAGRDHVGPVREDRDDADRLLRIVEDRRGPNVQPAARAVAEVDAHHELGRLTGAQRDVGRVILGGQRRAVGVDRAPPAVARGASGEAVVVEPEDPRGGRVPVDHCPPLVEHEHALVEHRRERALHGRSARRPRCVLLHCLPRTTPRGRSATLCRPSAWHATCRAHGAGLDPLPADGSTVRRPARRRPAHGRASSRAAATRRSTSSRHGAATSCTPSGSPSAPQWSGRLIAGWPVTLNGMVKPVRTPKRPNCSIGSTVGPKSPRRGVTSVTIGVTSRSLPSAHHCTTSRRVGLCELDAAHVHARRRRAAEAGEHRVPRLHLVVADRPTEPLAPPIELARDEHAEERGHGLAQAGVVDRRHVRVVHVVPHLREQVGRGADGGDAVGVGLTEAVRPLRPDADAQATRVRAHLLHVRA